MGDPDETSAGQGPLRGLRVLDIATIVAAPFAASLLAVWAELAVGIF